MLILHIIEELGYTAYIGSRGNQYIFNIVPTNEAKPCGGYPNLKYICRVKGIRLPHLTTLIIKAEEIMGKTIQENLDISIK